MTMHSSSNITRLPGGVIVTVMTLLLFVAFFFDSADAFWYYLPGIEPISYKEGDAVRFKVNSLTSTATLIPVRYYEAPFCQPDKEVIQSGAKAESLGELLSGDTMYGSVYSASMLKSEKCVKITCETPPSVYDEFEQLIEDGYRVNMIVDNLPVYTNTAPKFSRQCLDGLHWQFDEKQQGGFAMGVQKKCAGETLINNHIEFTVEYHEPFSSTEHNRTYRVVGFTAIPYSIQHTENSCNSDTFNVMDFETLPMRLKNNNNNSSKIVWSYSVVWKENKNVTWATRWDAYLKTSPTNTNSSIHWFGLINPLILTISLATSASYILLRTLRRDLIRYNSVDNIEEIQEEIGWKVVHGDVFRAPVGLRYLAVLVGSGTQVYLMFLLTLCFALLGFLSPANRGALLTSLIFLYCVQGFAAGFVTSTLLKMFGEKSWKSIFYTASAFPGLLLALYCVTDMFLESHHAANALSISGFFFLFALWFFVSLPLTVLGGAMGYRQSARAMPLRVNKLCRYIPPCRFHLSTWFLLLVPGVVPLAVSGFELRLIFNSLWNGMVYYMVGFLAIVFIMWGLSVALISILFVYQQLAAEDWRWWWSAFIVPGGCGIHMFLFGLLYWSTQLSYEHASSSIIFFLYLIMASCVYALVVGTIGFFSSAAFVWTIYSVLHID